MLRPSVVDGFIRITKGHEGIVPWPYLDKNGAVTAAMGNLADVDNSPTSAYFTWPWKVDNEPATHPQMLNAWHAVKARIDLVPAGGGRDGGASPDFAVLTNLRLGPPGVQPDTMTPEIQEVISSVFSDFERTLKSQLPNLDSFPADAQLALMEHAWAGGAGLAKWPLLKAALNATPPNFVEALKESHMQGVTAARSAMTKALWQNAIDVQATGADPDVLYYPGTVGNSGGGSPPAGPTGPAGPSGNPPQAFVADSSYFGGAALLFLGVVGFLGWRALRGRF